jgi:hypothetical protein
MRMRYLAFVFAAAIAALAMQNGTATKSAPLSVATVNIMGLQMAADKNLPETVIAERY